MFLGGLATGAAGGTAICQMRKDTKPVEAPIQPVKVAPASNLPFKNSTTSKTWHKEENPMIENASWFSAKEPKKAERDPSPEKKKKDTEDNENSGCVFHLGKSDEGQKEADSDEKSSESEKSGWLTGMFPHNNKEAKDETSKKTEDNKDFGSIFQRGKSDEAQKEAHPAEASEKRSWWTGWWGGHSKKDPEIDPEIKPIVSKPEKEQEPEKTGWFSGMFSRGKKEAKDETSKKTEDNKDLGSIFQLGKSDEAQKEEESSGSDKRSWWTGWWGGHSKKDPEIKPIVSKPEKEQEPEKTGWLTGILPQSNKEAKDETSSKKTEDDKEFLIGLYQVQKDGSASNDLKKKGFTKVQVLEDEEIEPK
jgi:hypothetical protein